MVTNYLVAYKYRNKYDSNLHDACTTYQITTKGRRALRKGKPSIEDVIKDLEEKHNAESLVVITSISEVT